MFYRHFKRLFPLASTLRRRHLAFCIAAVTEEVSKSNIDGRVECTSKTATAMSQEGARRISDYGDVFDIGISEGLLLYYDKFSFYSQKVVMALHEKKLPFESRLINLLKNEQYEPWFLYLNSNATVPVLQDTGKIIPDSERILDYLEDNFSNGDTPRLIPMDQGAEIRQRVTHFRRILQDAPQPALTTGSMLNQQLLKNPKFPFIPLVRKSIADHAKNSAEQIRKFAEKNPQHKESLLKKAANSEKQYQELVSEQNFNQVLNEIDQILLEVEQELTGNSIIKGREEWWLCSDRFTIADVELTILLERICQLGLEDLFWGTKPQIAKYYARVKQRDSYKKTIPGTLELVKVILKSQAPLVIGVGVVAAVALIIGGVFVVKRYIP